MYILGQMKARVKFAKTLYIKHVKVSTSGVFICLGFVTSFYSVIYRYAGVA